ncbi:FtsX-like permease family protein [Agrobacterium sp. MA01]|uniref:ABC transporter permease DevC n=1 Tax=Agrobacterium sp. MA01 TaxID=2664893 RepID=UPI00129BA8A9|nr:ABC transporter permease DevC [Agrobacterium sp. MA01]QGG92029.1 FtsX-like permease family protein [Agrobacterium sp. MA01]
MSRLLSLLFGRLPIGWLQLRHNRGRLLAALAGVAFATMLVFVQLGIMGALNGTIRTSYTPFTGDIIISSNDGNTLADGSPLARRTLYRALAIDGVVAAAPLYVGKLDWRRPDGSVASLQVIGLPIEAEKFTGPQVTPLIRNLAVADTALIDRQTRGVDATALAGVGPSKPLQFEVNDRTISGIGTISIGGGFSADGIMVVSDQTFLSLFPNRISGTPSHLLLKVSDLAQSVALVRQLQDRFTGEPIEVHTLDEMIAKDVRYQTTQRPTGVIFGFGVFMGVLVGIVIVYQVLSTDVADHLREYATLKAVGYPHRFFLSIVFEEALVLAAMGFIPGLILAMGIYQVMSQATGLPVLMSPERALMVFAGTLLASTLSGALAARRLKGADPADLF